MNIAVAGGHGQVAAAIAYVLEHPEAVDTQLEITSGESTLHDAFRSVISGEAVGDTPLSPPR